MPTKRQMITLKQGDTLVPVTEQLVDVNNDPVNLTGCTVNFFMEDVFSGLVQVNNVAAVIDDAPNGKVRYVWAPADVAIPGTYKASFIVTRSGAPEHFPPDDTFIIQINPL